MLNQSYRTEYVNIDITIYKVTLKMLHFMKLTHSLTFMCTYIKRHTITQTKNVSL